MLSTKSPSVLKREVRAACEAYHKETLLKLGGPNYNFLIKLAFQVAGRDEKVIGNFTSEMDKQTDIFIEFADEHGPKDPERKLYRWRWNPHYKEECETHGSGDTVRYLIPVSELEQVYPPLEMEIEEKNRKPDAEMLFAKMDMDDELLSQATVRDLLAILSQRPVSKKAWLNKLIVEIETNQI